MSTFAPAPESLPGKQDQEPLEVTHYNSAFTARSDELPGASLELRDVPPAAWLGLLLTANFSVAWSNAKLLSQDEVFVLQTDSVGSLRHLIEVQRHAPISLDPLVYHIAGYFSLHLFHAHTPAAQAYALRLPSLLGFLLMQLCLFFFVRRTLLHAAPRNRQMQDALSARRAGLVALLLPALTATFFYSAEARPYGLLLGLCGVILVSWQAAVRASPDEADGFSPGRSRGGALVALAVSLGLALNTHYFAVLLLLPLAAAELYRYHARKQFDVPMLAALAGGCSAMLCALPFQHAAGEFRAHYYNVNSITGHAITQAYRSLFVDYTGFTFAMQRLLAAVLLLGALVFVAALFRQLLMQPGLREAPETIFLLVLAALPFAGFAVGRFATHSFEVRYVVCALPALCALFAFLLAGPLGQRLPSRIVFTVMVVALIMTGVWHIQAERQRSHDYLASLQLSPAMQRALADTADGRIYMQDVGAFEPAQLYIPALQGVGGTPEAAAVPMRGRLSLLHSREEELRWDGHDTASLTAMHLQRFTVMPTVSWQQFSSAPGPRLLVLYHSGWDWTDQALAELSRGTGAQVTPVGPALGGDAVLVR